MWDDFLKADLAAQTSGAPAGEGGTQRTFPKTDASGEHTDATQQELKLEDEGDEVEEELSSTFGGRRSSVSMPSLPQPTAPPSPHIRTREGLIRIDLDPNNTLEEDQKQIEAKRDCVSYLLAQLVVAAEANYQTVCRQDVLRDWAKKAKDHPVKQMEFREDADKLDEHLREDLWVWDNARAAALWLQEVVRYNMCQKLHKEQALLEGREPQTEPRPQATDRPATAKERELTKEMEEMREWKQKLRDECLEIGFSWLDTNRSGSLEPTDVPEITAEEFSVVSRVPAGWCCCSS